MYVCLVCLPTILFHLHDYGNTMNTNSIVTALYLKSYFDIISPTYLFLQFVASDTVRAEVPLLID